MTVIKGYFCCLPDTSGCSSMASMTRQAHSSKARHWALRERRTNVGLVHGLPMMRTSPLGSCPKACYLVGFPLEKVTGVTRMMGLYFLGIVKGIIEFIDIIECIDTIDVIEAVWLALWRVYP